MTTVVISLFIAATLPIALSLASIPLRIKTFGKIDINNPRTQAAKFEGIGERLSHAQSNAWEALALYISAIVAMIATNTDLNLASTAASMFVVARFFHAGFYIAGLGILRFLSFVVAAAAIIWIYIIAFSAI